MNPERNVEKSEQASHGDHLLNDLDYKNIVRLLCIFERQLAVTLEESHTDFETVLQYFLELKPSSEKDAERRQQVLSALQYRDRLKQRTAHVSKRLIELAHHLQLEDWAALNQELENELRLVESFYDESQTETFSALSEGFCALSAGKSVDLAASDSDGKIKGQKSQAETAIWIYFNGDSSETYNG